LTRPLNPRSKARKRFQTQPSAAGSDVNLLGSKRSKNARGGFSQERVLFGVSNPQGKTRAEPASPRRRAPQNPHDPTSKDPFMRAGLSMGTNKTKIFKRAGMSMGG